MVFYQKGFGFYLVKDGQSMFSHMILLTIFCVIKAVEDKKLLPNLGLLQDVFRALLTYSYNLVKQEPTTKAVIFSQNLENMQKKNNFTLKSFFRKKNKCGSSMFSDIILLTFSCVIKKAERYKTITITCT